MAASLGERARELLDAPSFATLATIAPDGSPQLSVVWVKRDGDDVLVSTVEGRRKQRNMARDPRVSLLINPSDAPYSYVEIRGAAAMTTQGGRELIDELSNKYRGKDYEIEPEGTVRVVVRITPHKVVTFG